MSGDIKLPARLDLPAAVRLANELRDINGPVSVDASEVSHMGALGLQTLAVVAKTVIKRGDTFQMIGSTDKVLDQMKLMGTAPEQLTEGKI
ncbi:MAG: STAS domain-containing protein [Aliishimia sp.]